MSLVESLVDGEIDHVNVVSLLSFFLSGCFDIGLASDLPRHL